MLNEIFLLLGTGFQIYAYIKELLFFCFRYVDKYLFSGSACLIIKHMKKINMSVKQPMLECNLLSFKGLIKFF